MKKKSGKSKKREGTDESEEIRQANKLRAELGLKPLR